MKVLCGTDIIEINRIKESIERKQEKFLNKIFTAKEIEYCESKGIMKYQHYAVRFAAKEAIFKAVSTLLQQKSEITWKNAEILRDKTGKPVVNFISIYFPQIENIDISLSHNREYAIANVVILERD